jgi:hypothetical protein
MNEPIKLGFYNCQQIDLIYPSIRSKLFNALDPDSQDLMKLIKYNVVNPYLEDDLTVIDIINLVSPTSQSRLVFDDRVGGDIEGFARTELRFNLQISLMNKPLNYFLGDLLIWFQIITHNTINSVYSKDNYTHEPFPQFNRKREIFIKMMDILHGIDVNGIGELKFYGPYQETSLISGSVWLSSTFSLHILIT